MIQYLQTKTGGRQRMASGRNRSQLFAEAGAAMLSSEGRAQYISRQHRLNKQAPLRDVYLGCYIENAYSQC